MAVNRTQQQKALFLARFRIIGNVSQAALDTGVLRNTVYFWRGDDATFEAEFLEAELEATEHLEAEARRRAVDGLARKKFDKGKPVIDPETGKQYVEHEYSDTLLIVLLKARAPERYKDRSQVDQRLDIKGNVQVVYAPQMAILPETP